MSYLTGLNKRTVKYLLLSGLGSLAISYSVYLLCLQSSQINSAALFGLVGAILLITLLLLFNLFKYNRFSQQGFQGIAALFILSNLVVLAGADFRDIPYTIPLLPVQTVQLSPGTAQTPVQIEQFGTELYETRSVDQLDFDNGWIPVNQRELNQAAGADEPFSWTGKPGEYITFTVANCEDCGTLRLSYQDEIVIFNLEENPQSLGVYTFQFPSLAWLRALNFLAVQIAILALSAAVITGISLIRLKISTRLSRPKRFSVLRKVPPEVWLTAFPLVVFAFKIKPIIFNDDWCQIILPIQQDSMSFFELHSRRPLHVSLSWIFSQIFPIDQAVFMMQVVYLALLILITILIYRLLLEIFCGERWLALLGALLSLFYPNDFTYFYLSILGLRFSFLMTLIAMLLFRKYQKTNQLYNAWLSAGLILIGLLSYEGQFGLYLAWPLALGILFSFSVLRERFTGLVIYYLPAVIFPIWRFLIHPYFYQDSKLAVLKPDLPGLANSLIEGFSAILGGFSLPYHDNSWLTLENWTILTGLLVLSVLLYFAVRHISWTDQEVGSRAHQQQFHLRLLAAGFIIWGSGYFPIILNFSPNIWGHLSRVNIFTIPGAVLILIAAFLMIANGIGLKPRQSSTLITVGMTFLILFGAVVHLQVQESTGLSWQKTKSFYQRLFTLAPDLADGTQIFIYLLEDDSSLTTHRPLFSSYWEPDCAIQTLYDSSSIDVSFLYQRLVTPVFPDEVTFGSTMHHSSIAPLNPEKVFGVRYDQETLEVSILENVTQFFGAEFQNNYRPEDLILKLERELPARKLVE